MHEEVGLEPLALPVAMAKADYNHKLMTPYVTSFTDCLDQYLREPGLLRQLEVPGALELSYALNLLAQSYPKPAVLVALGCVVRGETYHFEIVSEVSAHAIQRVSETTGIPVINGILTCNNAKQARQRIQTKGQEAARAAIRMANLSGRIT